jgi:hypothetical protein
MPKAAATVFVRVGEREFIADRILFQETERVADADVVVGLGQQPGRTKSDPIMMYKSVLVPVSAISPAGGGFDRSWAAPAGAMENASATPRTTFAIAVENPVASFIQYSPELFLRTKIEWKSPLVFRPGSAMRLLTNMRNHA